MNQCRMPFPSLAHAQLRAHTWGTFKRCSGSMSSVRARRNFPWFVWHSSTLPRHTAFISCVPINALNARRRWNEWYFEYGNSFGSGSRRLCRNQLNLVVDCRTFTWNRLPRQQFARLLQSDKLCSNHHATSLRLQFFIWLHFIISELRRRFP